MGTHSTILTQERTWRGAGVKVLGAVLGRSGEKDLAGNAPSPPLMWIPPWSPIGSSTALNSGCPQWCSAQRHTLDWLPVFPYLILPRASHSKIYFLPLNASPRACCLGEIKLRKPLRWEYWSWVVTTRHC